MHRIYTLGYAGLTSDIIARISRKYEAIIIDVRYKPNTGKNTYMEQFNKDNLEQCDIDYRWMGNTLGNLNYFDGNLPYSLPREKLGLMLLSNILKNNNIVLLCGCSNPFKCHRTYIARKLKKKCKVETDIIHLVKKRKGD